MKDVTLPISPLQVVFLRFFQFYLTLTGDLDCAKISELSAEHTLRPLYNVYGVCGALSLFGSSVIILTYLSSKSIRRHPMGLVFWYPSDYRQPRHPFLLGKFYELPMSLGLYF